MKKQNQKRTPKIKLIPPDPKRCQALRKTGCWPTAHNFMVIGPRQLERCANKPSHIVYETKAAADGLKGSMSLCPSCLEVFLESKSGDLSGYRVEAVK